MNNYPPDFPDASVKFRNVSLSQNEKEMVSGTSPVVKTIVIDYFIDAIKKQNLKNPIIVSGDAPVYSTFSYTATEGDKVAPKYSRGISVIVTDWNAQMKAIGDVLSANVYKYETNRNPGDPARKIEETTYGWVEQINLEITFWAINSSKGRDIGGQFIKRTMLEGQKTFYFLKNGIMSVIPASGFDSNDTALLKTNGSILYQHVTRWVLTAFFFINTSLYEATELISGINFVPTNSNGTGTGTGTNVFSTEFGVVISGSIPDEMIDIPENNLQGTVRNQDENLNAYATITLSDRDQPNTSLWVTTTIPGQIPQQQYPTLNNYYLSDDAFNDLLVRDAENSLRNNNFILNESPGASNVETTLSPVIPTSSTTTSSTTTTSNITTTTTV